MRDLNFRSKQEILNELALNPLTVADRFAFRAVDKAQINMQVTCIITNIVAAKILGSKLPPKQEAKVKEVSQAALSLPSIKDVPKVSKPPESPFPPSSKKLEGKTKAEKGERQQDQEEFSAVDYILKMSKRPQSSKTDLPGLIQESGCRNSREFVDWLQKNKPHLNISYVDISMAFWDISQNK